MIKIILTLAVLAVAALAVPVKARVNEAIATLAVFQRLPLQVEDDAVFRATSFAHFTTTFGKQYSDEEFAMREQVFQARSALISVARSIAPAVRSISRQLPMANGRRSVLVLIGLR